jgi:hypothetical protein
MGILLLVALIYASSTYASFKMTIYGQPFTPGAFIADDGKIYFITDREIGKKLMAMGDIFATKVKVTGMVTRGNGRWLMEVMEYGRFNEGYRYPHIFPRTVRSDTPELMEQLQQSTPPELEEPLE